MFVSVRNSFYKLDYRDRVSDKNIFYSATFKRKETGIILLRFWDVWTDRTFSY